ncbi:MAG: PIG-L family deacetylase [Clostridia bacterium]|nr:PIG-L family deacetylase [Clostridia bacterium]
MGTEHVFYFSPHQDDELLNFGAAVIRDTDSGLDVHVVLCTDGGASSARRCLCDGGSCVWHEGSHFFDLSPEAFTAARDGEFIGSCLEMGVPEKNICISPLRSADGKLSERTAEDIILDAIKAYPAEEVSVKTLAPVYSKPQNPDHTATGEAAKKLFGAGAFAGLSLFYELILLDGSQTPFSGLEKVGLTPAQRERFIAAESRYGMWEPELGSYAVGFHSVYDEFTSQFAEPVSYLLK